MNEPIQPLPTIRAGDIEVAGKEHAWLLDSLFACGVGVIGGTPKSGKTWLGLEMAVSVASGTLCLDKYPVCDPGPALIYLAEDAAYAVRDRVEALARWRNRTITDLDLHLIAVPSLRLDRIQDMRRLAVTVRTLRPRLLLLDPFIRLHRADENNAQDISALLGDLRTLQRTYDVSIVLVHHTRKQSAGRQHGQALRGSGDLHAWGDSNLYLVPERTGLRLAIEHRAAPAPPPLTVRLATSPPHLEIVTDPEEDTASLEERILTALRASREPMTAKTLRDILRVRTQRVHHELDRLTTLGRIRRDTTGWTL